tara:strand:- start:133223 stop:133513 length:291 start_codon:yes stop_codon:yes gene_type:complete
MAKPVDYNGKKYRPGIYKFTDSRYPLWLDTVIRSIKMSGTEMRYEIIDSVPEGYRVGHTGGMPLVYWSRFETEEEKRKSATISPTNLFDHNFNSSI